MIRQVRQLLQEIGVGKMTSLAYDTAWIARLGEIDWNLSSQALEWLCANQLPDGSWGAEKPFYYHDRVISTLAAMISLTYRGRRSQDKAQIERGLRALENITSGATQGLLSDPNGATVGFEMIVPTLVAEAEKIGLIKQRSERILGRLAKQRKTKLNLIKDKKINRYITASFSSEMAGLDGKSMLDIENLQEANGSVGHSPSATAYYILYLNQDNDAALDYLRKVALGDGAPDLIPFDVFETTWVLWNLSLCSTWDEDVLKMFDPFIQYLHNSWNPQEGIGLSIGYSIPDGDDTSLVYEVLAKFNQAPDIEPVLAFEEEEHFRTYHFEANSSRSVNIHSLGALRTFGFEIEHPVIQKLLHYLNNTKVSDAYWVDKWNLSPYYTTSHAIIACAGYANSLVENSIEWILSTQLSDGSWGQHGSTAEETAYSLQALNIWSQKVEKVSKSVIKRGALWLEAHIEQPYPPLWIGKGLYSPMNVVQSAIISALKLSMES